MQTKQDDDKAVMASEGIAKENNGSSSALPYALDSTTSFRTKERSTKEVMMLGGAAASGVVIGSYLPALITGVSILSAPEVIGLAALTGFSVGLASCTNTQEKKEICMESSTEERGDSIVSQRFTESLRRDVEAQQDISKS